MAGTTNVYNVDYHFETGGKINGPQYYDSVSAAANDYTSILTVLTNNGRLRPGTLVIDNVQADPSGAQTILT